MIFGHSNVPRECTDNKTLATWVRSQRYIFKKSRMTAERIQLLESIGFQFDTPRKLPYWNERYKELIEHKKRSGTLNIKTNDLYKKQLRGWVQNQISSARRGVLEQNKVELLLSIGMDFSLKSKPMLWETRYSELQKFHDTNGHCDVPQLYKEVVGLGKWVNRQRQAFASGKLSDERVNLLNNIQFIWKKKRGEMPLPIK